MLQARLLLSLLDLQGKRQILYLTSFDMILWQNNLLLDNDLLKEVSGITSAIVHC
jgi:hypothetical protein